MEEFISFVFRGIINITTYIVGDFLLTKICGNIGKFLKKIIWYPSDKREIDDSDILLGCMPIILIMVIGAIISFSHS